MADHIRRQVRDAVVTRVTGLATTGTRVFKHRVDPLEASDCPALLVRNGAENIGRASIAAPNPVQRRLQTVYISPHVRASSAVDDALDQVAKEVEVAMLASIDAITLGGLAIDCTLIAIDEPRISGEGDRLVAAMDMQFQILINAREGIPDAVI